MNILKLLALVAGIVAVTPAFADEGSDGGRFYAGATAGTLGIGPEVAYRLNETVGVRANATFLSINHGIDSDGVAYDGSIDLKSGGAMVDLFPFGGGFRISGGFRINGNKAEAVATPTQNVEIGDATFTPAQIGTLRTSTDIKNFAPALTLGYAGSLKRGFIFGIEAGALFQGTVRINQVQRSSTLDVPGVDEAAELERERREIQDDVDNYKVYPILQLTIGYRF